MGVKNPTKLVTSSIKSEGIRIPKKEDETDTAYFHNGILYDTEFYVNRDWIVCEYEEREDITVQK